ncbi:alpha/beta hydrolase [Brevibacillus sp. RS1.1]|uniref:ABC-three component system protein n=1 Tax=Brevibacillus sp. RS1.1 TaxID=2738982 RepID=UPI00156B31B6|nr:ABC-three component system protein [Brevibacillus sp. RS1.1]NRR02273.1 alpha/beta hydrolase [Brevibacillus sp. RS1.1]
MIPIQYIHQKSNKNLILFVHGFTGGIDTWGTDKESFPSMLVEEEVISSNYDLMCVNYYSKIVEFYIPRVAGKSFLRMFGLGKSAISKNIGIAELGEFLKSVVEFYCSPYKNVIIVAHSMGGLVTKSFLLNNKTESKKVKLFLSLAVPHNGTDWARLGEALSRNHPQLIDLKPLSKTLNGINTKWIHNQVEMPKTIYFYGQYDEVVSVESAIAYENAEPTKVACNDDHFSITKPSSKDSLVYVAVKKYLVDFIVNFQSENDMLVKPFKDEGQLDHEIFVLKLLVADVHKTLVHNAKSTFFNAEYMRKFLIHQSIGIEELTALYSKIEHLYSIAFGKILGGTIKDSNDLVTEIHQNILDEDKAFLKSTIPLIDAYHKTGMLHQLANDLEKDVWWAKVNSINDLQCLREAMKEDD